MPNDRSLIKPPDGHDSVSGETGNSVVRIFIYSFSVFSLY